MKKTIRLFVILTVFLLASCTMVGEQDPFCGVWESHNYADNTSAKYIFTSDGHYAFEERSAGELEFADFGIYTKDDLFIYMGDDKLSYSLFEKTLTIDDELFNKTSRSARYSTSANRLKGVWKNDENLVGFSNGYAVVMGANTELGSFADMGEQISIDGEFYDFAVINNKLYVRDGKGFFSRSWGTVIFEHETSAGTDMSTRAILTGVKVWNLIDSSGTVQSVYTFMDGGSYTIYEYRNGSSSPTVYQGTFSLSGHRISLSNNADLDYAVIDQKPFMYTI